jgi:hypothetical protein
MEVAATAPVVSALPKELAHLPTARLADVADWRSLNVVDEVRVTTTVEVFFVDGLVSLTDTLEPFTAVTDPVATANCPAVRPRNDPLPDGRCPPPGNSPPEGAPPLPPAPGNPPRPPAAAPAPPNPPVQVPDVGWVMETIEAVTGTPNACPKADLEDLLDDFFAFPVGFPVAVRHEPVATADAFVVTVCWNVVVGV